MSEAGSINPLQTSSIVSWSFCSKFWSPVEGPCCTGSCVFWRDNVRLPLTIIKIILCVSVPMQAPTTWWVPEQACSVWTQCQIVSTSIISLSSWLSFPSDTSHLVIWLFKKNGFLAVCGEDLGSELKANSLRRKGCQSCLSSFFSLWWINPQSLVCTVSWNQWRSSWTWVWTSQIFYLLLT